MQIKISRSVVCLGIVATVLMLGLNIFLLCSYSIPGTYRWENLGKTIILCLIFSGPLALILSILARFKWLKIISIVFSILVIIIAIGLFSFLQIKGNSKPNSRPNITYLSSQSKPLDKDTVHIAFGSDPHWGASNASAKERMDILKAVGSGDYDAFFVLGDIADLGIFSENYELAISDLEKYVPEVPTHFLMGNHDAWVYGQNNFRNFMAPDETKPYHRIDVTDKVHVLVLNMLWDAGDFNTTQKNWLISNLEEIDKNDTVIVVSHAFAYGSGYINFNSHDAKWYDLDLAIEKVVPILEEYDVDLMISGHNHILEYLETNGVGYAVIGAMGGIPDMTIDKISSASKWLAPVATFGYLDALIDGSSIQLAFKDSDGQTLYTTSISED